MLKFFILTPSYIKRKKTNLLMLYLTRLNLTGNLGNGPKYTKQ